MEDQARRQRNVHITVLALFALAAVFVGMFVRQFLNPTSLDAQWLRSKNAVVFDQPRVLDGFTLVDDQGKRFEGSSFNGQWNLLFFGYSFCPDICPVTMAVLKQAADKLRERGAQPITVYLVSVDPERDSPQQLASYVRFFDPGFRGLTGEFLDLHRFATQLNVAFRKVADSDGRYLIDHSAQIALVDPQGRYRGILKAPHNADNIAAVMTAIQRVY